ncbi:MULTISPECIES: ExbD/TolR family protein [Hymenobacter]|uniref:Biopolymer transporter ExbD n=2 Tax=Hymenobacter TaxID=89966 RepID=A0ABS6X1S2_9BACT|nr:MULTISPECIES: biopolymer transporter ExbD [Hymenobacter]MBO3269686.1 biopolymer transporter ExbD [Hymenobacter defluvii]MBW3129781.1 biopolymer transporter ExbD [Hymenobacter profundi]QNE39348.1 biopolymer transporter ExbD [Hymenobacter sp. NBH84]
MNLTRRRKLSSHVETSSMNDIMFFLMLFFLIVSTMVNPNVIKLMLPNARSGKAVMKQTINVSVNANGEYFIDRQPVTAATLEQELGSRVQGQENTTVVLRVDSGLNVQKLVDVLEIGNRLKIKMVMATQAQK